MSISEAMHANHADPVERGRVAHQRNERRERWLNIGFTLSIAISASVLVLFALAFAQNYRSAGAVTFALSVAFISLLVVDALGCLYIAVADFNVAYHRSRMVARATMTTIAATVVVCVMLNGLSPIEALLLFQIFCLVSFQTYTDEMMARNTTFDAPWHVSSDTARREYIPLNFFNLFWVFVVASILGLLVEVIYFAIVFDAYPDRAGLLWGPFSPIYGAGAALMTVALNRYWNRNILLIFGVAGLIGAAFEFFASWFFETAFGIVAWDYSGTFLNIQGRTNFAFFCAWGFLGLVWIKLFLPIVMKMVDAIPVRLRIALTTAMALFMLVDISMTLITLDCWYERQAGIEPSNPIAAYCADHYGDDFMAHRFESMSIDPSRASRLES